MSLPTRHQSKTAKHITKWGSWIACCLGRGRRAPLRTNDADQLAADVGEESFVAGDYVFRRGEPAAKVHVVRSGSIELSREINGRVVALQILRSGDVFGDVPAFLGSAEIVDAVALEDSKILSFDVEVLFALLQTRSQVARRWIVSLAERMEGLHDRLSDLLAGSVQAQVCAILIRESSGTTSVRLTHRQLAEMVGAARSSVQRALASMQESGLIELKYGHIVVLDVEGLRALGQAV